MLLLQATRLRNVQDRFSFTTIQFDPIIAFLDEYLPYLKAKRLQTGNVYSYETLIGHLEMTTYC